MSNAFDKASLVMLPHAYEEGKLYSLKPTDRSGDFTFSRGTDTATRVNEQGYIEKETQNLLTYSNDFGNSAWVKSDVSVTGGQTGYDGSSDAWLLENTGNSGRIFQSPSPAGVYTISVYAKAGNVDLIWINIGGGVFGAYFDLSGSGSVRSTQSLIGGKTIKASIESIGSGWFRCVVAGYFNQANNYRIYPSAADGDSGASTGSNIYIQDAMLNQGLVSQPYLETTTVPVYGGLTDNMPRLDYTDASCPSLLLEPSRTNIIESSEYIAHTSWSNSSLTITDNEHTSPEGVVNAAKVIVNSSSSRLTNNMAFTSGDNFTISAFVKKTGSGTDFDYIRFQSYNGSDGFRCWFNITNGTKGTEGTFGSGNLVDSSIENYGDGWYRISVTGNIPSAAPIFWIVPATGDNTNSVPVSSEYYLYGCQAEAGSYPTSYIPTYGSTQTRAEDFFDSSADFTNFFGDNQGTIYIETDKRLFEGLSTNEEFIGLRDDTKNWRIIGSQSIIFIQCTNWGSSIQHYPSNTNPTKYLFKWDGSNVSFYIDGILIGTATQTAPFNPYQFGRTGNGVSMDSKELLNQFTLFPTALSDAECIALTTIV